MAEEAKKQTPTVDVTYGGYPVTQGQLNALTGGQPIDTDKYQQAKDTYYGVAGNPEDRFIEVTQPKPEKSNYAWSNEFVNKYFPTITPEEEERRANQVRQANKWGHFGRVATALGNAIMVGEKKAVSQALPEYTTPNVDTWRKGLQGDRMKVATALNQQDNLYNTALQNWYAQKNAADLNNQKVMAQADKSIFDIYKSLLAQDKADKDRASREAQAKAKNESNEKVQADKNKTAENVANIRAGASSTKSASAKPKGKGSTPTKKGQGTGKGVTPSKGAVQRTTTNAGSLIRKSKQQ